MILIHRWAVSAPVHRTPSGTMLSTLNSVPGLLRMSRDPWKREATPIQAHSGFRDGDRELELFELDLELDFSNLLEYREVWVEVS
jgi:hypothetical protein